MNGSICKLVDHLIDPIAKSLFHALILYNYCNGIWEAQDVLCHHINL